jgi:heptosyltransferase-1
MSETGRPSPLVQERAPEGRILAIRLGAMGDIIFTLPAVASLKHSFPGWHLTWAIEPQWVPLLEQNPFVDSVLPVRRDTPSALLETWRLLRAARCEFAVDFQGLIKSALVASAARAGRIFGFHYGQARERLAALFYSDTIITQGRHMVEKHLDLAAAAGAVSALRVFPLPPGHAEGDLPAGDFVLASPLAGWRSKQWPLEHYRVLAHLLRRELDVPLVLDGPTGCRPLFTQVPEAVPHTSSVAGLIYATRRAAAVVGVDSGPLHIAAALGKPGVALYGPTDPARNGPYGDSLRVLRVAGAITTYERHQSIDQNMKRLAPEQVFEALRVVLAERRPTAGHVA